MKTTEKQNRSVEDELNIKNRRKKDQIFRELIQAIQWLKNGYFKKKDKRHRENT